MARSLLLVSALLLLILNVDAKSRHSRKPVAKPKPVTKPKPAPPAPQAPTDDWRNAQFPPWFFYQPPNGVPPKPDNDADDVKPPYKPPTPPPPPPGPLPPNYGDFVKNPSQLGSLAGRWSKWSDLGGSFRNYLSVAYGPSPSATDYVVTLNSKNSLRVKSVTDAGTTKWISLGDANPLPGTSGYAMAGFDSSVDSSKLYVYTTGVGNRILYEGSTSLSSLGTLDWTAGGAVSAAGATGTPAAVTSGGNRYVFTNFVTSSARELKGYKNDGTGWSLITTFGTTIASASDPTTAVYTGSAGARIVVATVGLDGYLYVSDTLASGTVQVPTATDIKCVDNPQAVTVGRAVEIYCRGADFKFYCTTVADGEDPDYRVLDESDGLFPTTYVASYRGSSVYLYSRTEDGRVGTKKYK